MSVFMISEEVQLVSHVCSSADARRIGGFRNLEEAFIVITPCQTCVPLKTLARISEIASLLLRRLSRLLYKRLSAELENDLQLLFN